MLEAFQMLCPGCVSHGLPQASRVHQTFDRTRVAVIGLHTVFEHHQVMTKDALGVFIHEYRIPFPIGADTPGFGNDIPRTMKSYGMQGTPTLVLIDQLGRIRQQHFGSVPDLQLGAEISALLCESESAKAANNQQVDTASDVAAQCSTQGCPMER
ncbi:peroxiredoxin family protein [Dryocola clanedunensis]